MDTNSSAHLSTASGFTLLEVIIALAIMTITFASILSVESSSIQATSRAKQMNIVGMLAKNQMVETEFKIQGKKFAEIPREESGQFEAPYESYRWKTGIKPLEFPNFNSLGAAGKQSQNSGGPIGIDQIAQIASNYFSKSLSLVTVTVFWKQGTQEQSFSLSTFWVDFTNAIPLPF